MTLEEITSPLESVNYAEEDAEEDNVDDGDYEYKSESSVSVDGESGQDGDTDVPDEVVVSTPPIDGEFRVYVS